MSAGLALSRFQSGHITAGQGLALVLAATLLLEPLDRVGSFFYVGMGGIASLREIRTIMSTAPAVADPASPDNGPADPVSTSDRAGSATDPTSPVVVFDQVDFAYEPGSPVLRDASFTIQPGERVALTGVSGTGKTTIAALLCGERRPDSGGVRLLGHDVTAVPLEWQRAQVAVVNQHTYLFYGTLRHNLLIAAPQADDAELWQALEAADLAQFVTDLPEGWQTQVGEHGLALSGGQIQRLAIARAYLKNAPLLLLDEPTAHVDLASEQAILAALRTMGADRAVLTISHRRATIADADRVLVLADGAIQPDDSAGGQP